MQFYLAAPFFNEEQANVCHQIEYRATEIEGIQCFSPRIEALCPPGAPVDQRKKSFDANCDGIRKSDFVLARIDDYDPGTIWELGFAHGWKLQKAIHMARNVQGIQPRVYCFTTVESGRGLNLMLAQGSNGFLQGLPSVMQFLKDMAEKNDDSLATVWMKEIV